VRENTLHMRAFQFCKNCSQKDGEIGTYEISEGTRKDVAGSSGWGTGFAICSSWSGDVIGIGGTV